MSTSRPRIAFVTGKLAAPALEAIVQSLAHKHQFEHQIIVQKISVAALLTVDWLRRHLELLPNTDRLILPGNIRGNLELLAKDWPGVSVERGPIDLLDLPQHFGDTANRPVTLDSYDIEILSEINHANRLPNHSVIEQARQLRTDGANIIDLGATPGEDWPTLESLVQELTAEGFRVSIDSFDVDQVTRAVAAGASLVLSVNRQNLQHAADWGVEVVAIPDDPHGVGWLKEILHTSDTLTRAGIPHRLDPVLEPIGFGFAQSLSRYMELRRERPDLPMMMGVGNLTELTEVDSAGINFLLVGLCQEIGIQSVLTTQVINYARNSTREIDIARRMVAWATSHRQIPKNLGGQLTLLRDPRLVSLGREILQQMQQQVRDPNFRIFVDRDQVVAFNSEVFAADTDPFRLFDKLGVEDPSHAFYLGWEMMKASLAIQLGKQYVQDRALRWGYLTTEEISHRDRQRQADRPAAE
jgi:dihydropteroate synthase-like protein